MNVFLIGELNDSNRRFAQSFTIKLFNKANYFIVVNQFSSYPQITGVYKVFPFNIIRMIVGRYNCFSIDGYLIF